MHTKIWFKILVVTGFILIILVVDALPRMAAASQSEPVKVETQAQTNQGAASTAEPVILTDTQGKYPLGLHMAILEDPTGMLTSEDVSSQALEAKFVTSQVEIPNFGLTTNVYWVRLRLDNETSRTNEWLLEDGYVNAQYVDLYTPRIDGKGFDVKQTGFLRPNSTRDVLYPRIVFNLNFPPRSQQTYFLRFQSEASMTLPLTLWTMHAFFNQSQSELLVNWLFFGAILALLVYHVFLLFSLREASYLFFVLLLGSLFLFFSTYTGYLGVYVFPGLYRIKYSIPLFLSAMIASVVLFSDAFLEIKRLHPRLHRINLGFAASWALYALLTPFIRYHMIAWIGTLLALICLAVTFLIGIHSWGKGFHPARFFMAAWLGLITTLFLLLLVRLGVVRSTFFTENIYQPGLILMAVGWSIALADRINILKAETDKANRNLRNSEGRLSQILEGLPLGVVFYTNDHKPKYANRRSVDIFSNPDRGIQPDISAGRTLEKAIRYFSLRMAGSREPYPIENFPAYSALQGSPAYADDIEVDRGEDIVPLEMWANPIQDETGIVDSAVIVFQDITQRKHAEAELAEYRKHLESLVEKRTIELNAANAELNAANTELRLHLEWLGAVNLVNQIVARTSDFAQIYQKFVEITNQVFAAQDSFIAELDKNGKQLKILAHSCQKDCHAGLIGSFTNLPDGIPDHSHLQQGKIVLMTRDQVSLMDGPFGEHIRFSELQSIVGIPLQVRERVLGFLGLEMHEEGRALTSEESNLLNIFSTDIAQIIENARLIEQAKELVAKEERNRIARELHDSVAQALYAISLYSDAIRMGLQASRPQAINENMEELILSTREAMADMRLLIFQLRPPILEEGGLLAALQSRLESVEARTGFKTYFHSEGELNLTADQESELYWIAQEILNNVLKHAHANVVKVELIEKADYFRMTIEDNGVGFDPEIAEHSGGQGLRNIRERAEKIGATCRISSAPGQGAKISIEMDR